MYIKIWFGVPHSKILATPLVITRQQKKKENKKKQKQHQRVELWYQHVPNSTLFNNSDRSDWVIDARRTIRLHETTLADQKNSDKHSKTEAFCDTHQTSTLMTHVVWPDNSANKGMSCSRAIRALMMSMDHPSAIILMHAQSGVVVSI